MCLIETHNLVKRYTRGDEDVIALDKVNSKIEKGSFVSIAGPSGSGKTTLLNIIGCLDRPTSGDVFVDGIRITSKKDKELVRIRREKIGFVFQTFSLIETMTALENVELPLYFARIQKKEREKRAVGLLKDVDLGNRVDHYPSELSGGELQRVAIARALANDPEIILADEPTGNLDSETGGRIISYLKKLNVENKKTFVIATHDLGIAGEADVRLRLKDGRMLS
ncbi:MAG: ABC transporter ATP-binding protein [Thermoplasmata archaeon]|nr:ABC transporter ATP-binding protein [Thermoplasmata archaeon]